MTTETPTPKTPEDRLKEVGDLMDTAHDNIATWLEDRDVSPTQARLVADVGEDGHTVEVAVQVDETPDEYRLLADALFNCMDAMIIARGGP